MPVPILGIPLRGTDEVWPYDCVLWIYDRIQYLCGQLYEQGIRDFGWLVYKEGDVADIPKLPQGTTAFLIPIISFDQTFLS